MILISHDQAGKLLEAIRRNSKDVRPEDLENLLIAAGFTMRAGKVDHRVYSLGTKNIVLDFGRSPVF